MLFLFWVCLIGLIVGALAKAVMPGTVRGGCIVTILLGIAGSIVGSYLGHFLGFYAVGEPAGFFMSVAGAVVILAIFRALRY
ncbi:MAG: GlsB/YeaQ/YmgE family stress response membrane protein [Acidobacteriota bacterium]|nr:GlsB/YeaQ/YmgE family stress response membrane protein [Acidobacteriota bacterium]